MNSYWQVLRTYLWRPRFWVIGFFYLLMVWGFFVDSDRDRYFQQFVQPILSAVFASLAGCFLALHIRRQFSYDSAHLTPGYASPHLVVASLVSALLWFFVPTAAILSGHWPPGALALHAFVAVIVAAVICWPRAIVLLIALPLMLVWENRPLPPGQAPWLEQFIKWERPELASALVGLAFLSQFVAGVVLLRLPLLGVTTNDEFSLDSKASVQDAHPLNRWFLAGRDAAAERLLEARLIRSIQQWRVPVATSFAQLSIPAVCVLAATGIGLANGNWQDWSAATTAITCAVLLFVPLAPWHARRHAMSQEILLPVTRPRYFRQIIISMALDMALWMTVASVLIAVVGIAIAFQRSWVNVHSVRNYLIPAGISLGLLWSMAIFVFGIGLATMRWPLWLPIVAGTALLWLFAVGLTIVILKNQSPPLRNESVELAVIIAGNVVIGLLLTLSTYRRWVRSDIA
jgi:hypothetical protein